MPHIMNVIQVVRFRKVESDGPVREILREIAVDLDEAGNDVAVGAEIFALVRYPDGTYNIYATSTSSQITRVGEIEAIKAHLLVGVPTEVIS